jgi:hypothetical protein
MDEQDDFASGRYERHYGDGARCGRASNLAKCGDSMSGARRGSSRDPDPFTGDDERSHLRGYDCFSRDRPRRRRSYRSDLDEWEWTGRQSVGNCLLDDGTYTAIGRRESDYHPSSGCLRKLVVALCDGDPTLKNDSMRSSLPASSLCG